MHLRGHAVDAEVAQLVRRQREAEAFVGVDFFAGDVADAEVFRLLRREVAEAGGAQLADVGRRHAEDGQVGELVRGDVGVAELAHPLDVRRIDVADAEIDQLAQRQVREAEAVELLDGGSVDVEDRHLLDLLLRRLVAERAKIADGLRREIGRGEDEQIVILEVGVAERGHLAHERLAGGELEIAGAVAVREAAFETESCRRAASS